MGMGEMFYANVFFFCLLSALKIQEERRESIFTALKSFAILSDGYKTKYWSKLWLFMREYTETHSD